MSELTDIQSALSVYTKIMQSRMHKISVRQVLLRVIMHIHPGIVCVSSYNEIEFIIHDDGK